MKFKVGDRVRVIGGKCLDGELGTIDCLAGRRSYYVMMDKHSGGAFCISGTLLEAAEQERHRVYIWGDEKTAEVFQMTVDALFGYSPERTGSALVMSPVDYAKVCEKTYATHAAIVAEVCRKTPDSGAL